MTHHGWRNLDAEFAAEDRLFDRADREEDAIFAHHRRHAHDEDRDDYDDIITADGYYISEDGQPGAAEAGCGGPASSSDDFNEDNDQCEDSCFPAVPFGIPPCPPPCPPAPERVRIPTGRWHHATKVVLSVERIPITEAELPIADFWVAAEPECDHSPMAVVALDADEPTRAWTAAGCDFLFRYGCAETQCLLEAYSVSVPAGAYVPPTGPLAPLTLRNMDLVYMVASGTVTVSVGDVSDGTGVAGLVREFGPGASIGVKRGTPHIVQSTGAEPALLFVSCVQAGIMAYYLALRDYEVSVGGAAFLDQKVIRRFGRAYGTISTVVEPELPVTVASGNIIVVPGPVEPPASQICPYFGAFLPLQPPAPHCNPCHDKFRDVSAWGTGHYQILVLQSVLPSPPGPADPSTLRVQTSLLDTDTQGYIQLQPTATSITVRALVIADPAGGTATVEYEPTINGALTATLATNVTYGVHWDSATNNVYVTPLVPHTPTPIATPF
jgi:mannose-6-phosphate isomerase-like protein (cupin superfamily)